MPLRHSDCIPKSTGKERDSESNLDNFGARYDSSQMGRFMSPDALGPAEHPENPQTWNLYSYTLNNPLALIDPTGQYTCASSVTQQECDNFQAGLNQAQTAANALKDKYGADSDQYQSAQRAINAYGKEGVDNGVVIAQGNTGSYAAVTQVAGATVAKTADNPTGQNIVVTLNKSLGLLDSNTSDVSAMDVSAMVEAHEGSHVADASDWVSSGFSSEANPSHFQTELDAYHVTENIAEGLGYSSPLTISFFHSTGNTSYPFSIPPNATNGAMNWLMIVHEYPNSNLDAFSRNTRIEGAH